MIYNIGAEKEIRLLYSGINDVKQEWGAKHNLLCSWADGGQYIKCKQPKDKVRETKRWNDYHYGKARCSV
jgi:hypothetical protein